MTRFRSVMALCRDLTFFILPPQFDDPAAEAQFLQDFRRAGLTATVYACSVAVAGYVMIWAVDLAFNGWSGIQAVRRLVVMALLSLTIGLVLGFPTWLLRHYTPLLGVLVFITYVASVTVTHLFRSDDPTLNVAPTALLGLWIIYGFFRLPLKVTVFLGLTGGACALFGTRLTNAHDPAVRTLVYLLIANAFGVTHSRSVEIRERHLFLQRRTLEEAQAELGYRSRVAEQASAEKTRLMAAVGHDLRQPMMAAILHMSVLMRRLDAQDSVGVLRQADRVLRSVKMLGETLEDLLLAARYESGTEPIQIRPVLLSKLFQEVGDLSEPQAAEKGSVLLIRVPRSGLIVMTDERTLLRCLVNLVSNALKFTSSSGTGRSRVVVRAGVRKGLCRIVIADNGIGVADSDADSIWQPFFQVGNRERNRDNGLGLGLYLVKQSLLRLDGHVIQMRSTLGKGTCFVLSLPVQSEVASTEIAMQSSAMSLADDGATRDQLRGAYILLVEDDQEAREALQAQLDEWGVVSSVAGTMDEVLHAHAASERSVDAIIADYRLPGERNGIALIYAMRDALGYEPEAVLMTAEVDFDRIVEDLPERTGLLLKPFDPGLLRHMLVLAHARALKDERAFRSFDSSE
jgi:signal transduction histidine kinase